MKVLFDYDNKIVQIEDDVRIGALIDILQRNLGNDMDNWHLKAVKTIEITTETITVPWYPANPYEPYIPPQPWWEYQPTTYTTPDTNEVPFNRCGEPTQGVYCVNFQFDEKSTEGVY